MTEEIKRPKAKRRLKDISFEHEGAHVALVSKDQGGGANGHNYALCLKAHKFSEEFVEKASTIKIELDIVEYLQRFFNMYEVDAEVLARALGYTTKRQEKFALEQQDQTLEDQEQLIDPEYPDYESEEKDWEDYIQSRIASLEIMKNVYEADSIPEVLSKLDETQYLTFLQDQQKLEKAFKKIDRAEKTKQVAKAKTKSQSIAPEATVGDTPQDNASVGTKKVGVETSVTKNKEVNMTQEVKTIEQEVTVELVEKSALDSLQKALDDQKVALAKAMETIQQFEEEKKQGILKQRLADVKAAVENEAYAEVIFKAVKDSADEDFVAVVKALADIGLAAKQSEIFKEVGAVTEEQPVVIESPIAKALKARLANHTK